jgi:TRAP-type C4-dicarboxylate transport system permease small subunit
MGAVTGVLTALAHALGRINAGVLGGALAIGTVCVAVMVASILIQVFFRYVLGSALAWSEELARFLMLWMTGLMAPWAWRRGGFVGIDMLVILLPRRIAAVLSLVLLALVLVLLAQAYRIGTAELCGFVARSGLDALWVPDTGVRFDLRAVCGIGGLADLPAFLGAWSLAAPDPVGWFKVPRWWMMLSFHVGVCLMLVVTAELILRALVGLLGGADRLAPIAPAEAAAGAD